MHNEGTGGAVNDGANIITKVDLTLTRCWHVQTREERAVNSDIGVRDVEH
jgi:hypothetical protein